VCAEGGGEGRQARAVDAAADLEGAGGVRLGNGAECIDLRFKGTARGAERARR
jgi:hypothetical protein